MAGSPNPNLNPNPNPNPTPNQWRAFLAGSTSVSESPSWMMPRRCVCSAKNAEAEE